MLYLHIQHCLLYVYFYVYSSHSLSRPNESESESSWFSSSFSLSLSLSLSDSDDSSSSASSLSANAAMQARFNPASCTFKRLLTTLESTSSFHILSKMCLRFLHDLSSSSSNGPLVCAC